MISKRSHKKRKSAQEIQDENFRKMSADKKVRLSLKISGMIFGKVRDKIKSQNPNLHIVALSKKIHSHIESRREYYDHLFDKALEKELRGIDR